jgi:hypothetical protein
MGISEVLGAVALVGQAALCGGVDLDGDDVPDLLVSGYKIQAVSPSAGGKLLWTQDSVQWSAGPFPLTAVGDLDGDERPDICTVGSVGSTSGVVAISGGTGAVLFVLDRELLGGEAKSLLAGSSTGSGAPGSRVVVGIEGKRGQGAIAVLDVKSKRRLALVSTPSESFSFPWAVCSGGDFDGDGCADFAATGVTNDRRRYVAVYSGADFSSIGRIYSQPKNYHFGKHIVFLRGASRATLLIASPQGRESYVAAYSSIEKRLFVVREKREGDRIGSSLASVGDVDGDGVEDFATGFLGGGDFRPGEVWVCSGSTGETLRILGDGLSPPGVAGPGFGRLLTSLGDVDGDGALDLAIGIVPAGNPRDDVEVVIGVAGKGERVLFRITEDW